jgi:ATP-binding cassette subfamily B (MDR/TAP) protein 1
MKQEVAFFNPDHNVIGAICSRLLTNAFNLNELLGINFAPILTNIITFTCVSILGIAYGWRLGLVCVFAALPPILLSDYFCILLGNKLEEDTDTRFASSAAIASEAISAIRTVASLTLETRMLQIYKTRFDVIAQQSAHALTYTML